MSFEIWLFCGLVTGLFGMAYFVYGKKQSQPVPLIAGIALMVYPYFVSSNAQLFAIGVALIAIPYLVRV